MLKKDVPLHYHFSLIKFELAIAVLVAFAAIAAHALLENKIITIPISVVTILVAAMAIVVILRANQAQKRWQEASAIWGDIVGNSRTFARQIIHLHESWTTGKDTAYEDFRRRCIKRHIAWCYTLVAQLRGTGPMHDSAEYLDETEIEFLESHSNKAVGLLVMQAVAISQAHGQRWLNSYQQVSVDETLRKLSVCQSACERIKNSVMPRAQSIFTNFFLYLLMLLLPFSLIVHMGPAGLVAAVIIVSVFFLVEKITLSMQRPFDHLESDVPMTLLTRTIENDVYQTLGEEYDAKSIKSDDYCLM